MAGVQIMRVVGAAAGAVGLAGLLAPTQLAAAFGTEHTDSDHVDARLFSTRNLALGALMLTGGPAELGRLARVGVALNALDAALGLQDGRAGRVPPTTARQLAVASGVVAALCALALRDLP